MATRNRPHVGVRVLVLAGAAGAAYVGVSRQRRVWLVGLLRPWWGRPVRVVRSPIAADRRGGQLGFAAREGEIQRLRNAAWFAATLDLDSLALRLVEAALSTCAADAAAVTVDRLSVQLPLFKALNLSEQELSWLPTELEDEETTPVRRDRSRGVETSGLATELAVPLPGRDGRAVGKLAVLWRCHLQEQVEDRLRALEDVASTAWSAVENARRFEQVSAIADALPVGRLRRSA